MRNLLYVVAVVSCLLGTSQVASGCISQTLHEAIDQAAFIFAGTAVEIDEQQPQLDEFGELEGLISFTRFEVDRSWKGVDGKETTVLTLEVVSALIDGETVPVEGVVFDLAPGVGFRVGEEYLVYGYIWDTIDGFDPFPDRNEKFQITNGWFRTKPLSSATEDLAALGEPTLVISGIVNG